jgi:hypothetical protein
MSNAEGIESVLGMGWYKQKTAATPKQVEAIDFVQKEGHANAEVTNYMDNLTQHTQGIGGQVSITTWLLGHDGAWHQQGDVSGQTQDGLVLSGGQDLLGAFPNNPTFITAWYIADVDDGDDE